MAAAADRPGRKRRRSGKPEAPGARSTFEPEGPEARAVRPWSGADTAALLGSALVALGLYLASLSRTVNGGDSGELITVAHVLGVAHPPGYPLYTLLAKLFTFVPFDGIAGRVSLLSAVCDAGAAALLFAATRLWTGRTSAGVLAAGTFALSPLVWPYAIVAEVFALNNLFVAGLVLLSERLARSALPSVWVATLWLGLGLANHHTLVLFGLPFVVFLLVQERARLSSARFVGGLVAAFVLGLVPYLYLPWAAARIAPVSWGDPASFSGFFAHLLRTEYGTFRLAGEATGTGGQFLPRLALFWGAAAGSTFGIGLVLLLPALLVFRRPGPARALAALWLSALGFYLLVFCGLANVRLDDPLHVLMQARFWQQPFVVVCALLGLGLAETERVWPRGAGSWLPWLAALGLPAGLAAVHFPAMKSHGNRIVREYGEAILRSVPPDSLLVISSDEAIGSVRYLQHVERLQPETRVLPIGIESLAWFRAYAARRWPDLVLPPDLPGPRRRGEASFSFRALLDANRGRFPIFVCNRAPWLQSLEEAYALWPEGLVERVRPKGEEPGAAALVAEAEESFARFDPGPALAFPRGTWERGTADAYWKQYERLGQAVAGLAARHREEVEATEATIRVFETLASRHPSPAPSVYKNLGVGYRELSQSRPEAREKMIASWRRYLSLNPSGDPDVPNIRKLLEDEAGPRP